ncbi:ATP-dependent helicase brm-like [Artemia franciscana]|uniref:ATP-dependent helicase brm-like n=1 Tax=Artemia franciscana TaxID=6661 RepID=UPI0032DB2DD1
MVSLRVVGTNLGPTSVEQSSRPVFTVPLLSDKRTRRRCHVLSFKSVCLLISYFCFILAIGAVDENAAAQEDEEEDEQEDGKRGRRGKKRRNDSEDEEPRKKRGKIEKDELETNKKLMKKIMKKVMAFTDEEGRQISLPFQKLPTRRELPDYYDVIKKPLDIKKILKRIELDRYETIDDLEKDFSLLCRNAQVYNEENSLIYADSVELYKIFTSVKEKISTAPQEDDDPTEKAEDVDSDSQSGVRMKISLKGRKSTSTPTGSRTTKRRSAKGKKYDEDDEEDDEENSKIPSLSSSRASSPIAGKRKRDI